MGAVEHLSLQALQASTATRNRRLPTPGTPTTSASSSRPLALGGRALRKKEGNPSKLSQGEERADLLFNGVKVANHRNVAP